MQWHEVESIVEELQNNHSDVDLDEITASDIYDLILDLPDFSDDPDDINESKLKRIIEAWIEYRQDL
jgi:FeS assembly protein IscX